MRTDTRSHIDATVRRTQPNWFVECLRIGVPLAALPETPPHDAPYADKRRYTWKLRKLWEQRAGRRIERLTPPGYHDKLTTKRKATRFNERSIAQEHKE